MSQGTRGYEVPVNRIYLDRIIRKLDILNVAGLTRFAISKGLVSVTNELKT